MTEIYALWLFIAWLLQVAVVLWIGYRWGWKDCEKWTAKAMVHITEELRRNE